MTPSKTKRFITLHLTNEQIEAECEQKDITNKKYNPHGDKCV